VKSYVNRHFPIELQPNKGFKTVLLLYPGRRVLFSAEEMGGGDTVSIDTSRQSCSNWQHVFPRRSPVFIVSRTFPRFHVFSYLMSTSAFPHFSLITHFPALFVDYTVSQHLEPATYFSRAFLRFPICAFSFAGCMFPCAFGSCSYGFNFTLILKQS